MKNTDTAVQPRQSNIELLRIILAIGIIVLHSVSPSMSGVLKYVLPGSANAYLSQFLSTIFISNVDVFFMITGYFMLGKKRLDIKKPVLIIAQLIITQLLTYFYLSFRGETSFCTIGLLNEIMPKNWFITLYIGLILLAPFLSTTFSILSKNGKKQLIIVLLCLYSLWPSLVDAFNTYTGLEVVSSALSIFGDNGGYSILVAVVCFFIGAVLRDGTITIKKPWFCYTGMIALMYVINYIYFPLSTKYNSPFVLFAAASLLSAFLSLDIRENKVINYIARCTLMVYLMHLTFMPKGILERIASMPSFAMLGCDILVCLVIFAICFVINEIYSRTFQLGFNKLFGMLKFPVIDISVDGAEAAIENS